jgi:IstB-like ATP binding protein
VRRMERRSAADLDGMGLFMRIVDHGSLSAAGRALGIPKGTLSRRLVESLLSLDFLEGARNVVLVAPGGLGKTARAPSRASAPGSRRTAYV